MISPARSRRQAGAPAQESRDVSEVDVVGAVTAQQEDKDIG